MSKTPHQKYLDTIADSLIAQGLPDIRGEKITGASVVKIPRNALAGLASLFENDDPDDDSDSEEYPVPDGTPSEERYEGRIEFAMDAENHIVRVLLGPIPVDQVQVTVKGETVYVEANHQRKLRPGEHVLSTEIPYGIIEATFSPPPGDADLSKLRAEYFSGLLILTVPKTAAFIEAERAQAKESGGPTTPAARTDETVRKIAIDSIR